MEPTQGKALICQSPRYAVFGDKSLPGLGRVSTQCHLFHRHPLYMAWDDGSLGLVRVQHLCRGARGPGCWPSPFGSSRAARTLATGSHPVTCTTALKCGFQFSRASFQSLLIHWLSLEFPGPPESPCSYPRLCAASTDFTRGAFLGDLLLAFP